MKTKALIGSVIVSALFCSPAVAATIEALSGHWESNPANCSKEPAEGYGLIFDGSREFAWINHATEGGMCQVDGSSATCGAEEGEQSPAHVSFRMSGNTLYVIGPWQDEETPYTSCGMAEMDLMP